jgi:outer membrane protein TolC
VAAQRGSFYPTVQASFSPSYNRTSSTLAPVLSNNQLTYSLFTAQVTVGFTPDVFGGTRRQVEALIGQAEAQRFQREAAYLMLTSNVVAAAIQEASVVADHGAGDSDRE